LGELIQPLIARGQSLSHICAAHKESIPVSERTLYTYIGNGVFDIRNIDLPKKVAYRKRHEHKVLTRFEYKYREGRTIADFNAYLEANPTLPVVEMDTVKGKRGSLQVFLTMIFRETSFMLIFPMKDGTQESVIAVFDMLNDRLGTATFRKLFPVILTDNGVEFKDPESLEQTPNGSQRTRVFFCDPQASWQKPQVENNHRLIRRIVPKGVSFDTISSEDVRLITRHINSVLRDQYEGKCPFDLMVTKEQKKLLESLRLTPVPPDEVLLKPDLIKH
jgi:IS30 family transposase